MELVRINTTVKPKGRIVIDDLPFEEGKIVEVTVSEGDNKKVGDNRYPLRGTVLRYDDPFEPLVQTDDWEALQ